MVLSTFVSPYPAYHCLAGLRESSYRVYLGHRGAGGKHIFFPGLLQIFNVSRQLGWYPAPSLDQVLSQLELSRCTYNHKKKYMYHIHILTNHLVHLSVGGRHPTPRPSMTSRSLSSQVVPLRSRSIIPPPSVRSRTPLESNFHPCCLFA
jgi:hypothetical protein